MKIAMRFAAKDFRENKNTVLPRQSENLFYFLQSVLPVTKSLPLMHQVR